ncbi:MAG: DNA polymerase I [Acidobacteria bacterium]|nr:DNA polymerase I [Acidobacteriota bacterium]
MPKPTLFLIDGSNQMYRAYHAIRGLTAPDGRSTNAIYGFVAMLRKLIADHHPPGIAAAFDLAGPTFRSELAADYKATRAPMPSDLVEQISLVHEACRVLGVPVLTYPGFEADDVIGTLAIRGAAEGRDVAIVTGDKDFFQLVSDRAGIRVFNPRDEGVWYDEAGVTEKFGVAPGQVVDVLALMGDAVDNIKGVPGIGEKGARDLISTYGSLDALLDHAGSLTQKKYREALLANPDSARDSRMLLRIRTDVPLPVPDLSSFDYNGPDRQKCFELFSTLGFRSLVTEFAPTADTVEADYAIVSTEADLSALSADIHTEGRVALGVVGDSPGGMRASMVGLVLSTGPHRARYIPIGHTALDEPTDITGKAALAGLRSILENPAIRKVGHDLKFVLMMLAHEGVRLDGLEFDTMLASYVLDATRSSHTLEEAALEHLGYKALVQDDICGSGQKAIPLPQLPASALLTYAGERADLAWQLADTLAPRLHADGLDTLFRDLEMPLVPVLADIERHGVRIDLPALASQSQRIDIELGSRSAKIFELAGEEFNINSPKQLSVILFDKLKLPAAKRTGKTKVASTAVDVLEDLALSHEIPKLILEWRALQKLNGTYIDALPQLVHSRTTRVHTSFNQAVAATGRLSSSDPNLQNIPIRTDLGREIRRAFIADPGCVLISADYSQIELRVLAHLADEEALIDAFRRGEDIHDRTALKVFGATSGLDPHELRRRAKIINYALLYGKTAFTLARDIGVTPAVAQEFIDSYFGGFPRVRVFIDQTIETARARGFVETMFGRRRMVPELNNRNAQIRMAAERMTVNFPIQGTAADILKRAMLRVHELLRPDRAEGEGQRAESKGQRAEGEEHRAESNEHRARMILTVHDELLIECPAAAAGEVAGQVRDAMEHAASLTVPLTVDVGIGPNWREAKP